MRSTTKRSIVAAAALGLAGSMLLVPQAATAATTDEGTTDIQLLSINDFHGRLEQTSGATGVAGLSTIVEQYTAENPNTMLISAGDNIGASTFTSFISQDTPTMQGLVAAGLQVSAVGNHEFDKGYDDLVGRVTDTYAAAGADAADLTLGANVYKKGTTEPALPGSAIKEIGGVKVGFIGTVTPETATKVSPTGIEDIEFGDQVEAANREAETLKGEGAQAIVLLTHSGFASSEGDDVTCDQLMGENTDFSNLVTNATSDIDVIISAHTHQTYNCVIDGRTVIQQGQYGEEFGDIDLSVDNATGAVTASAEIMPTYDDEGASLYAEDPALAPIVDAAVATAAEEGTQVVGQVSGDILRGGNPSGDDRGVESTAGNTIADIYLWATTDYAKYGGEPADLAVMNAGGIRADILYGEDGTVTYKAAADMQPFANTITTTELTGAAIKQLLEEQWQPGAERPKLQLGVSDGFSYEYVDNADGTGTIMSMTLNGEPIDESATYTVTTNSFVSAGGDGFTAFNSAPAVDAGLVDLEATVDYFAEHDVVDPAPLGRAVVYAEPAETPTPTPTTEPTSEPTTEPTSEPTTEPTSEPTAEPTTPSATTAPTDAPSDAPIVPAASTTPTPGADGGSLIATGGSPAIAIAFGAAALIAAGAIIAMRARSRRA